MSYLVLARKYRPKTFHEMVGQGHVLKTLINTLENGDLHHAYLFTGTRGVGKTTVARIFAKCLNNPSGISATPDLASQIAQDIDKGSCIDLIEVDAASRTKVEQTRELLENIHYPPSQGRFRIYLIDEVHMLSTHSFNALLKTLEEPPEHVKFLLATTDPQKLPVTIVSRCLQFHLKHISLDKIEQQLQTILDKEDIQHETSALRLIAQAGKGSMRDALSILDQAVAFTNRKITKEEIASFLGVTDRNKLSDLVTAIVDCKAKTVLTTIDTMVEFVLDYQQLLDELLLLFQQAAIIQQVSDYVFPDQEDNELVKLIAHGVSAEQIQLYYQIVLRGKHELTLVSNQRSALEMIMLRMLAFAPVKKHDQLVSPQPEQKQPRQNEEAQPAVEQNHRKSVLQTNDDWLDLYSHLELEGFSRQIMGYAELVESDADALTFRIGEQHMQLLTSEYKQHIQQVLVQCIGAENVVSLHFQVGDQAPEQSPLMLRKRNEQMSKDQQFNIIEQDPEVKALVDQFDATIVDTNAVGKVQ